MKKYSVPVLFVIFIISSSTGSSATNRADRIEPCVREMTNLVSETSAARLSPEETYYIALARQASESIDENTDIKRFWAKRLSVLIQSLPELRYEAFMSFLQLNPDGPSRSHAIAEYIIEFKDRLEPENAMVLVAKISERKELLEVLNAAPDLVPTIQKARLNLASRYSVDDLGRVKVARDAEGKEQAVLYKNQRLVVSTSETLYLDTDPAMTTIQRLAEDQNVYRVSMRKGSRSFEVVLSQALDDDLTAYEKIEIIVKSMPN